MAENNSASNKEKSACKPKAVTRESSLSNQAVLNQTNHDLDEKQAAGNMALQRLLRSGYIQTKLTISSPDDPCEREADRVANKVTRIPAENEKYSMINHYTSPIQKPYQAVEDKIEEKKLQSKINSNNLALATKGLSPNITAIQGKGHQLPDSTRTFFESRFGHDLGQVRIHTDSHASDMARTLNAKAFTIGNDIAFASGEYRPNVTDGKRLLAHEITHVAQQNKSNISFVQRKLKVAGKFWKKVPDSLKEKVGDFGMKYLNELLNDDLTYETDNIELIIKEAKKRSMLVEGLDKAHRGCCIVRNGDFYLDKTYWIDKSGDIEHPLFYIDPKLLKKNKKTPADAVEAIFTPNAGTILECASMSVAIQYYALLKTIGREEFNKRFPGGKGIVIRSVRVIFEEKGKSEEEIHPITEPVRINNIDDLQPGDLIYFQNIPDYATHNPAGAWSGEWAYYLGDRRFRGFGMTKETKGLTQQEMYRKLIDEYNKGAKKRDQVTTVSEAIDKTKKLEAKEKKKKNFGMEDIAFRPVEIVGL